MTQIEDNLPFINSEKFHKLVDDLVWEDDITYLEAVMIICDRTGIAPEDLMRRRLISPNLKEKLHQDGVDSGVLKEESRLPI